MVTPHEMTTLTHIMEKMRINNTDNEFTWSGSGLSTCAGKSYQPHELEIVKTYRFEGITDPSDTSILYIIEAKDGQVGYRLDPYGVYSGADHNNDYDNFIRMVPKRGYKFQLLFTL